MKKIIIALVILSFYSCSGLEENRDDMTKDVGIISADTIKVYTDKKIHPVRQFFWGTNLLFWIENDAALIENGIVEGLKNLNIKLLRYPGGTVADNFHWKTNMLDNVHMFPFAEGEVQTDFDEFIQVCKKVGAEPSVVVNTESWAVKGDIPAGAHEAANWLRYCKEKGYDVKFWEIGNETYWQPCHFCQRICRNSKYLCRFSKTN